MNINVTLFGQMITFAILVGVTMRYIWPPLIKALDERQETIAKSLREAEERSRILRESEGEASEIISQAKAQANDMLKKAETRAAKLVEEGRVQAQSQAQKLLERARTDIEIERRALKDIMVKEMGKLVIVSAERLLREKVDLKVNDAFLEEIVAKAGDVS